SPDLLVFSDLDGTLLDHRTYSWQAARPGLDRLKVLGAGLVLASSKTASEIKPLREELGFAQWPAIVENGAGILWPTGSSTDDNTHYEHILDVLSDMPEGFTGFASMGVDAVARATGLSREAAKLACQRQFSEPGLWQGSDAGRDAFLQALQQRGLQAAQGGRFLTVSLGKTKADAMREVVEKLRPSRTIALGDAPNDRQMIDQSDYGVIV
ncbi:unnamed protein product, partial [Ectocarpus sp. 12 AP-2014]